MHASGVHTCPINEDSGAAVHLERLVGDGVERNRLLGVLGLIGD